MDKQLVPLKKKLDVILKSAKTFSIKNEKDMIEATKLLSNMNQYSDSVKAKKEELTKPLNTALKAARAMFSPIEDPLEEEIDSLRLKMSDYQTEVVRLKKVEEANIAARIKEGRGNLTLEKAAEKIAALPTINKEVSTDQGLVQFREVKVFTIVDVTKIPLEFLIPNEKAITEAMKSGRNIAGVEYSTKQVPVNYR